MAKTLSEAPITTRSARVKLAVGVHWRGIDPATHLGYRRGARGGKWLVRWRDGRGYRQEALGTADDTIAADGVSTLDYGQASRVAKRLVEERRAEVVAAAAGRLETVANAVEDYSEMRETRVADRAGGRGRDAGQRLRKHVLASSIADKPLHVLSEDDLSRWRSELNADLAGTSVRRLVNDFRAALNFAAKRHRAKLPATLSLVVKNGLGGVEAHSPVARETQVLADFEIRDIIAAAWKVDEEGGWGGDLGRLVLILAATGARFGQVAEMKVADVQTDHSRLLVPKSHKGRSGKAVNRIGVRVGDDVLKALRAATAGRKPSDPLLERWRHRQLTATKWERVGRGPWSSASEMLRPWRLVIAKSGSAEGTIPYALRHSSIVRGLRAGLPVRLVGALHDTSSTMIELHYSAWIVDALDSLAAAAVIPLTE